MQNVLTPLGKCSANLGVLPADEPLSDSSSSLFLSNCRYSGVVPKKSASKMYSGSGSFIYGGQEFNLSE
jgi:hypothetical protein